MEIVIVSFCIVTIGSLLWAVLNQFIDTEDMSDISEAESLRLTDFCSHIHALVQPHSGEARGQAPTAVYTPNWLKFQYLTDILESSLAGIKYLWAEGELRLEVQKKELEDLGQALFAKSEYRRKAIREIRRGSVRKWTCLLYICPMLVFTTNVMNL